MKREDYAKQINWNGTATREIKTNELTNYKIGDIIKAGLCWTDGGEFAVETKGKYSTVFIIIENVNGHDIDYENEQECEELGCVDCEREIEILIDRNFEVVDFWEYDEETGFAKVFLRAI